MNLRLFKDLHTISSYPSVITGLTCFPLARFNVDHSRVVLLREVFQQDHVVLFVGVVDEHRLGSHTQHLERETARSYSR